MKSRWSSLRGMVSLGLALVVLFTLGACRAPAPPTPQETLDLGATVPFQNRAGIDLKNILEMNADLLNKAGGLNVGGKTYKIQFHIYDDKYQADPARAAMETLASKDNVKFIIGTFGSACVLAMTPISEPNKIPIFSGAASDKLLDPQIKYFQHCHPAKMPLAKATLIAQLRPAIKSVVVITYDDETGRALAPYMGLAYSLNGIKPVQSLFFARGQTDFSSIASKVLELNPDMVHLFGLMSGADYVQPIKALREVGYTKDIFGCYLTQADVNDTVAKVGKAGVEGIMCEITDPTFSGIANQPPAAVELRKNYEKYYGTWETDGVQWAGCWYTFLAAVQKAGSLNPDKVMAAIDKDLVVQTPIGAAKFFRRPDLGNNRYCDYATVVRFGVVKDGQIVFQAERDPDFFIDCVEKALKASVR